MKTNIDFIENIDSLNENSLVLVFSDEIDKIEDVYSKISSLTSNFVFVSTDGEIKNKEVAHNKTVVCEINFEKSLFEIVFDDEKDSFKRGVNLAKKFSSKPDLVLLFSDSLHTNGEELLNGLYSIYKDLKLSGGMAGDASRFLKSFVGYKDGLFEKGAVGVGIFNKELEVEIYSSLGWVPIGNRHKITKAKGNIIYEIDNKKALEFYYHYLGKELASKLPKIGIEFPLMVKRGQRYLARAVLKVLENGALQVGGKVKEGEDVYIGIALLEKILTNHLDNLSKKDYDLFLVFSCMARERVLGEKVVSEHKELADYAPTAGFFSYGEFNNNKFVNQTFTLCAIKETSSSNVKPKKVINNFKVDVKNSYYLGLINILDVLAKEVTNKEKRVLELQEDLRIKTELINSVKSIGNIKTFKIEDNNFELEIFKEFKDLSLIYEFLKNPSSEYIEVRDKECNSYIIFAKKEKNKVYGVIVDISSIRKKDEMLIAQSRLAQMGEMIGMIAHQWRQPLNAIGATIIRLQIMNQLGEYEKKEFHKALSFISEITQSLSNTINEFLDFSKPSSKCEEILIENLIDEVINLIGSQLESYEIRIKKEIESFKFRGYKKEIEHILLNLILNSRDALKDKDEKEIIIRAYIKDNVVIEVEDNGGGIKVTPIYKIFEPYFSTKEQGTGLGLYLSKKIATEKLKGDLEVFNTEKGAKFILKIPTSQEGLLK